MQTIKLIILLIIGVGFSGCGSYFNQPVGKQDARRGELTAKSKSLRNLPETVQKVVVGVYNFKDQTGQYKPTEVGSSFSTAVTQGATTILLKALEDSKWFRPIERENIGNLLNERNIIDKTRREYSGGQSPQKLKPLLFAGILLEGGIISYDSNILTGGVGARYFGAGGSTQYRQDRITVYLRAISTSTGEILKTVYVSKTILSQGVDAGLFRFVNFQRLLEVETGFTKNEPAELAVKEAIEKAVEDLIYEGIKDRLWYMKGTEEEIKAIVANYEEVKTKDEESGLYNRTFHNAEYKHSLKAALGSAYIDGDFASSENDFSALLGYRFSISDHFKFGFDANFFRLNSSFNRRYFYFSNDAILEYRILKRDKLSPYVYGGPGVMYFVDTPEIFLQSGDTFLKVQYGGGIDYQITNKISLFAKADYNYSFTDKLDNTVNGTKNDHYFNVLLGANFKLNF